MPFVSDLSQSRIIEAMQFGIGGVARPLTAHGAPSTLSYRFAGGSQPEGAPDVAGWQPLGPADRAAVAAGLARIARVIDVDFVRADGGAAADITIGAARLPPGIAGRGGPAWEILGDRLTDYAGYAVYDRGIDVRDQPGLVIHELAHAMGLAHPFGGEAALPARIETSKVSVMSYTPNPDTGAEARTLQLYDVLALQDLWTPDTATRTGDTTYAAPAGDDVEVVWDAGGTDMLDAAGRRGDAVLDLRPGAFSRFGDHDDLAIAYGAVVENARGGAGDDRLFGNGAGNRIAGGGGEDFIRPGAGGDVALGGQGGDAIYAGAADAGDDLLRGGRGPDILGGGGGDDRLRGGNGTDTLFGGDGDDDLRGFKRADTAWAGDGADTVIGGAGGDRIGGGRGADTLRGAQGRDTVYGGPDAHGDTIHGGGGADRAFAGGGRDALHGDAGADTLFAGPGRDTVRGGGGDDTLWGGPGADTLAGGAGADIFAFVAGAGRDTVADFDPARDVLAIGGGAESLDDVALGRGAGAATVAVGDIEIALADLDRGALGPDQFDFDLA